MKECLETNFHLSSKLLRKLCVHYATGFDNVESVYFFYSNTVDHCLLGKGCLSARATALHF
jgi:hypothetical protein